MDESTREFILWCLHHYGSATAGAVISQHSRAREVYAREMELVRLAQAKEDESGQVGPLQPDLFSLHSRYIAEPRRQLEPPRRHKRKQETPQRRTNKRYDFWTREDAIEQHKKDHNDNNDKKPAAKSP